MYYSPTHLLKRRLQIRGSDLTWDNWEKARLIARTNNSRFPVLAHQLVLREDEAKMKTSVSGYLGDPDKWRAKLQRLAHKGLDESDLAHWIWILEAKSSDEKVDRLTETDRFKPIFVLMAILRSDEHFLQGSSLVKVYDYIARTYCSPNFSPNWGPRKRPGGRALPRPVDNKLNMTPTHFMWLLDRLLPHCLLRFPSSIVMIARLVVDYIRLLKDVKPPSKTNRRTDYAERCMVFNHALQLFSRTPEASPVASTTYNWNAQRIMLGFSAGLQRPLIIDRGSYRAIRMVLTGLKKSKEERMAAARHVKTWPPYIKLLDGTDEARDEADYLSRSVKAGALKRSEGYPDDRIDRALDTTGGAVPGISVSVRQRATPVRLWHSEKLALSVFTGWAAVVKSTRNAQEAWERFHEPPLPGLKPNFQVYAEMFSKLFALEIDYTSSSLPGDGKETYPPYQVNLSEFERERLRPCSPQQLYEMMLRDGNRPTQLCLVLLVQNAASVRRAAQFLQDAALDKRAVHDMVKSLTPLYDNLVRIPVAVFDAYLELLCRLQPRRRWVYKSRYPVQRQVVEQYDRIARAIKLVGARMGPGRERAARPWHTIMRHLARNELVLRPYVSQLEDNLQALAMMTELFKAYKACQGLDPTPFDCLARCTLKVLRHDPPSGYETTKHDVVKTALDVLKFSFAKLTAPVKFSDNPKQGLFGIPKLYHELSAAHIETYLEVLARAGDVGEGVGVVEWVLSSWDSDGVLQNARDPGHKQWHMLMQAFVCFRSLVEETIDAERLKSLEERFQELAQRGGTWRWPSREDVGEYRKHKRAEEEAGRLDLTV